MVRAETEVVAHSVAALLIRRRVDDRSDDAAFDEVRAHADEEIILPESRLPPIGADFDPAAAARKEDRDRLRIFRRAREEIGLGHARARLQRDDFLGRRRKSKNEQERER
jgi:hypothetical protein